MAGSRIDQGLNLFQELQIRVDDGLPSTACGACVVLLESSFAFKRLVESSALKLGSRAPRRARSESGVKKEEFVSDEEGEACASSDYGDGGAEEEEVEADRGSEETDEKLKSLYKCEHCSKMFRSEHRRKIHSKTCDRRRTVILAAVVKGDCDIKTERREKDFNGDMKCDLVGRAERSSSLELLRACPVLEGGLAEGLQQFLGRAECQICKRRFSGVRGLKIHLAKCTGRRKRKRTPEGMNGSAFPARSIRHANSVALGRNANAQKENERCHMCESCGRAFKSRAVLQQHARTHDAARPAHSCQRCGKTFTRVAHLAAHHRIHDNVKPYICETCGRGFTKSSDLYRHRRVHSERRAFPCTVCGKLFKRSGDVAVHMRAHTGNRPFQCGLCDKNYKSHSSLKKHKKHHSDEAADQGGNTDVELDADTAPMNKHETVKN